MTDVEVLLRVDAGTIPPGTAAFVAEAPGASDRRLALVLSTIATIAAGTCAFEGLARVPTVLLALAAAVLAAMALPIRDPDTARNKRPTLVVTPHGVLMRDRRGLRRWSFNELAAARTQLYAHRPALLLVKRDGARELLDVMDFHGRGDPATAIRAHLETSET